MKIVQRIGVFETNSSSTHTLILISKDEWNEDARAKKPQYKNFRVLTSAEDKLYLACGCCHELFPHEDTVSEGKRASYARIREFIRENDENSSMSLEPDRFSCELAVEMLVRGYCDATGCKEYDALVRQINAENRSGRACHMRIFYEGALYDADCDYHIIKRLFWGAVGGRCTGIKGKIAEYFDDANVLCCQENWC